MHTLILFLLIALAVSFLCSILEAVVLSVTPSFIAAQSGPFGARLEAIKRDIDRPLAAILTLNTFAHTVGAAGVGAAAQQLWGQESLTGVSAAVTVLILIGSEVIPKTLGAVHWQRFARPVVWVTSWITVILWPAVWACQLITRLLRRGYRSSVLSSRADLSRVMQLGYRDGLVRAHERDIVANLMNQENVVTADIMTPLAELIACDETLTLGRIGPRSPAWHVSRIPVYVGDPEQVTGYVLKDEVLVEQIAGRRNRRLAELRRPIPRARLSTTLAQLYHLLIEESEHIAIVLDDRGVTAGVVTMEDLIEALLGEDIVDESDLARGAT